MNNSALGKRIHEARKQCAMSSDKLSELCGVGAVHIRKIESGAKLPSINVFVDICNALHTSPQYLLQDSLEPNDLESQLTMLNQINQLSDAQANMFHILLKGFSEMSVEKDDE